MNKGLTSNQTITSPTSQQPPKPGGNIGTPSQKRKSSFSETQGPPQKKPNLSNIPSPLVIQNSNMVNRVAVGQPPNPINQNPQNKK